MRFFRYYLSKASNSIQRFVQPGNFKIQLSSVLLIVNALRHVNKNPLNMLREILSVLSYPAIASMTYYGVEQLASGIEEFIEANAEGDTELSDDARGDLQSGLILLFIAVPATIIAKGYWEDAMSRQYEEEERKANARTYQNKPPDKTKGDERNVGTPMIIKSRLCGKLPTQLGFFSSIFTIFLTSVVGAANVAESEQLGLVVAGSVTFIIINVFGTYFSKEAAIKSGDADVDNIIAQRAIMERRRLCHEFNKIQFEMNKSDRATRQYMQTVSRRDKTYDIKNFFDIMVVGAFKVALIYTAFEPALNGDYDTSDMLKLGFFSLIELVSSWLLSNSLSPIFESTAHAADTFGYRKMPYAAADRKDAQALKVTNNEACSITFDHVWFSFFSTLEIYYFLDDLWPSDDPVLEGKALYIVNNPMISDGISLVCTKDGENLECIPVKGRQEMAFRGLLPKIAKGPDGQLDSNSPLRHLVKQTAIDIATANQAIFPEVNWILQGFSFHLEPGEHAEIIGFNGAGKSSILSLIARNYLPVSGAILINDQPIDTLTKKSLDAVICHITQSPSVFSGPIWMNVEYGDQDDVASDSKTCDLPCDDQRLDQSLQAVGLDTMDQNFQVGVDGDKLSGGVKQAVGFARVMRKINSLREGEQDQFIIFGDEIDANLDPEKTEEINDCFADMIQGKTSIRISHDLTDRLAHCDPETKIIYFLAGGKIEQGRLGELLEQQDSHISRYINRYKKTSNNKVIKLGNSQELFYKKKKRPTKQDENYQESGQVMMGLSSKHSSD